MFLVFLYIFGVHEDIVQVNSTNVVLYAIVEYLLHHALKRRRSRVDPERQHVELEVAFGANEGGCVGGRGRERYLVVPRLEI